MVGVCNVVGGDNGGSYLNLYILKLSVGRMATYLCQLEIKIKHKQEDHISQYASSLQKWVS